jgi:hypothetical protein
VLDYLISKEEEVTPELLGFIEKAAVKDPELEDAVEGRFH